MKKLLMNPGPTNVNLEVKNALITEDHSHRDEEFSEVFERVCKNLLKLCHGEGTHCVIPFMASGTGANEAILSSISGKILFIENGRYSQRLIDIAKVYERENRVVRFDPLEPVDLNVVRDILLQDPEIKYIAAVHHETTTSIMIPVKELGDLSREFSVPLIIDAISSIGGHDFDLKRDNVAFSTITANKCLESLPGISFVLAAIDEMEKLKNTSQSYYFDLCRQWKYALTNRTPFTAAIQLFFALDVALRRLLDETCEGRSKRYKELNSYLRAQMRLLGVQEVSIQEKYRSNIVSLFHIPKGIVLTELHEKMKGRRITIYSDEDSSKRNQFFLATMGDITQEDIGYFIKNFQQALSELGFKKKM